MQHLEIQMWCHGCANFGNFTNQFFTKTNNWTFVDDGWKTIAGSAIAEGRSCIYAIKCIHIFKKLCIRWDHDIQEDAYADQLERPIRGGILLEIWQKYFLEVLNLL